MTDEDRDYEPISLGFDDNVITGRLERFDG